MSQSETPRRVTDLPEDVCEDLLASRRRCLLLRTLAEVGELPVLDLAAHIRAAERGTDVECISRDEAASVRDDLFQSHLPKLTATGVVSYGSLLGKVRLVASDLATQAETVLHRSRQSASGSYGNL